MYASIITSKVKLDMIDQAADTLQDILNSANPAGWQCTYLVVDRQTGHLTSFGIWNSREEAVAYESNGRYQQDSQRMSAFMDSPPQRTTGEIILKIQP